MSQPPMPLPPDPWTDLRAHTAARIALGRAGAAMPTHELLRFGAAHAQARDAVHTQLDVPALAAQLGAQGHRVLQVKSAAPSRAAYLLRPDLGRRLSATDAQTLAGLAAADGCDLLLVVGDGLSSLAVQRHAAELVRQITDTAPAGWTLGPAVIATQARVALGDDIGAALKARMVAMLIGERPGLSAPDGIGIYLTWGPRPGRNDAQRNCISNVRPEGQPLRAAAQRLWWLCREARRLQLTGVGLKDLSDTATLDAHRTPAPPPIGP